VMEWLGRCDAWCECDGSAEWCECDGTGVLRYTLERTVDVGAGMSVHDAETTDKNAEDAIVYEAEDRVTEEMVVYDAECDLCAEWDRDSWVTDPEREYDAERECSCDLCCTDPELDGSGRREWWNADADADEKTSDPEMGAATAQAAADTMVEARMLAGT
jgi:hypothetical protein